MKKQIGRYQMGVSFMEMPDLCSSAVATWESEKIVSWRKENVIISLQACKPVKLVKFCFFKVSLPMRQAFRNSHYSKLQQNTLLMKNCIIAFLLLFLRERFYFNWLADMEFQLIFFFMMSLKF
jgi:hypothetical protein